MSNPNASYHILPEELKHGLNASSLLQKDTTENLLGTLLRSKDSLTEDERNKLENAKERNESYLTQKLALSIDFLISAGKNPKDIFLNKNNSLKKDWGKKPLVDRIKDLQQELDTFVKDNKIIGMDGYIASMQDREKAYQEKNALEEKNSELLSENQTLSDKADINKNTIKTLRKATLTKFTWGKYSAIGKHILNTELHEKKSEEEKMWLTLAFATRVRSGKNRITTFASRDWLKNRKTKTVRDRINQTINVLKSEISSTKDLKAKAGIQYIFERLVWASDLFESTIVPKREGKKLEKSAVDATQEAIDLAMAA